MSDATTATSSTTLMGGDTSATAAATSTTPAATTATAAATTSVDAATAAVDAATAAKTTTDAGDPAAVAKAAADKAAADAEAAKNKTPGAPEAYEAFTLPEGLKLDDAVMGDFQKIAKDLNLPQDAAQKLVDIGARMQAGNAQAMQAAVEAQGEQWGTQSKGDKEFGGDKFDENLAIGKKALDQFGTPELKNLLVQSKLGNHPEVLRFFIRAGKAISEDGFVPGRQGGNTGKSVAQRMYPDMNP